MAYAGDLRDSAILRQTALDTLQRIAPDVSPGALQPAKLLRSQVPLDSMDWLNLVVALSESFGVEMPETDYAKLDTLDDLLAYLAARR